MLAVQGNLLNDSMLSSLRRPLNKLTKSQTLLISESNLARTRLAVVCVQDEVIRVPMPRPAPAAFITALTQLCTALILVGPNPVGVMVRITHFW
jgi:hypothetical protein